jgi:hypothetical protein
MDSPTIDFDRLEALARSDGAAAAADHLIDELADGRDPTALFYAKLLKFRLELGVAPYPTGSAYDLPEALHEPYERAIRESARSVGHLLLSQNKIASAWPFFRLIHEPDAVRAAIDAYEPGDEDDVYPLIDVAFHQGVAPDRGFDLVLGRQGICATITLMAQTDLSRQPDLRDRCLGKLIAALHAQLVERLKGDLAGRGVPVPESNSVGELLRSRPELVSDDSYHIDLSHLQTVVQMGMPIANGQALDHLIELADYGRRLSASHAFASDPPFDDGHDDYFAFYEALAGRNVDDHLKRFRAKAEAAMAEGMTYPCHVLVDLLTRLGRPHEALAAAQALTANLDTAEVGGPNVVDLARAVGDHAAVAAAARRVNDAVTFVAALGAGS